MNQELLKEKDGYHAHSSYPSSVRFFIQTGWSIDLTKEEIDLVFDLVFVWYHSGSCKLGIWKIEKKIFFFI